MNSPVLDDDALCSLLSFCEAIAHKMTMCSLLSFCEATTSQDDNVLAFVILWEATASQDDNVLAFVIL